MLSILPRDISLFSSNEEFIKTIKFFVASVSYVKGWQFNLADINDINQEEYEQWSDYFCQKFLPDKLSL